jgi:hypothetical protein
MMSNQDTSSDDWMLARAEVVEQPFASNVPILGPLIVWLRTSWNNMAARWYVRPLTAQQNEFNRMLVQRIRDLETHVYDTTAALDRDQSFTKRDVAALELRLRELNRELKRIDEFLELERARNEKKLSDSES